MMTQRGKIFKYRILVVDDNKAIRDLIALSLTSEGYSCEIASSGTEALEMASHIHFDAVVTDIVMPGMDGIALTRKLSQQFPQLPIVVMTGSCDETSTIEALAAGARDLIKKPFSVVEFHKRLNELLRDAETSRPD
jgi:DNA-binding response OmpR family regulator